MVLCVVPISFRFIISNNPEEKNFIENKWNLTEWNLSKLNLLITYIKTFHISFSNPSFSWIRPPYSSFTIIILQSILNIYTQVAHISISYFYIQHLFL